MAREFNISGGMQDADRTSGLRYASIDRGYHGDLPTVREVNLDPTAEDVAPIALDASVDGQGGTIRGKPVFTIEQAAFYLNRGDGIINGEESGAQWFGGKGPANNTYYSNAVSKVDSDGSLDTLSYGFYESLETLPEIYTHIDDAGARRYTFGVARGFSALSENQRQATRDAIAAWDDVTALNFVETSAAQADIALMNSTTGPAQASAYLPYDYGSTTLAGTTRTASYMPIAGDIFINPAQPSNQQFDEGQYGLTTIIHEIGHSLGLEHPGNYNFSPTFSATYVNGAEYYQDSNQYSIMSYWGTQETGGANVDWNTFQFVYSATPGVHDIAAIQRIYGVDTTTRTGNSTYGFNVSADVANRDAYDFTKSPLPHATIWDAGGVDTIDVSGFNTPSLINLNQGAFSNVGGSGVVPLETLKARGILPASYTQAQYDAVRARYNSPDGLLRDNLSIAYGAVIENATGGSGNDTLVGNEVANVLNGGDGFDTVSYRDADAGITIQFLGTRGSNGDSAGDRYISIEAFEGTNFADSIGGGSGADSLSGLGGDDKLFGGDGDDTLDGGAGVDNLQGGNGNDVLRGGAGADRLESGNGNDRMDGGAENDYIASGAGNDTVFGGSGDDTLYDNAGDDVFIAGAGNDNISAGQGNDQITGGLGDDEMSGGLGSDTYFFAEIGGKDFITDFSRGNDKIDLTDLDANSTQAGTQSFTLIEGASFTGQAGQLISYGSGKVWFLAGDTNGDGTADFTIETRVKLTGSDLILADLVAA